MEITDKSLIEVLQIVFSSKRAMPAHYSSDNERSQTFSIDHHIDPDDEYEIAAHAYNEMFWHLSKITDVDVDKNQYGNIIKVGEDIALGAYLLQKKHEYASFRDLQQEIIDENINMFDDPTFEKIIKIGSIQNYFDFCQWFGRAKAVGFRWGNQITKTTSKEG